MQNSSDVSNLLKYVILVSQQKRRKTQLFSIKNISIANRPQQPYIKAVTFYFYLKLLVKD